MPRLRHILLADTPSVQPRRGELVVWVGPDEPPAELAERARLKRARTTAEAAAYVAQGPAELRLALRQPLVFLTTLAGLERSQGARAA